MSARGGQSARLCFGYVTIETSVRPEAQPPPDRLECEITVVNGDKPKKLYLRGVEVEDFMQCMQALARLKRKESDP